jgi:PAS domain S-box-containing protein
MKWYQGLYEKIPCTCLVVKTTGMMLDANRCARESLGYSAQELVGNSIFSIFSPGDQQRLQKALTLDEQSLGAEVAREFRLITKEGKTRWVKLTLDVLQPVGNTPVLLLICEEFTQSQRLEESFQEAQSQVQLLMDAFPGKVSYVDAQRRYQLLSKRYEEWSLISSEEVIGKAISEFMSPQQYQEIEKYVELALSGQSVSYEFDTVFNDGTRRYLLADHVPHISSSGKVLGFFVFCQEFTERKQAEEALRQFNEELDNRVKQRTAELELALLDRQQALEALRQSESRYRAIIEDQTELVCRIKPDGTLTFVNDAYCRYLGKTPAELIGQKFLPLLPSEDEAKVTRNFRSLNVEHPINTYSYQIVLPSGEIRWQQWTERGLFDEQGNLIECQAVGRDITQLKQAEAEIRNALEKEKELSELRSQFVSLVSHEFRTPLTTIVSSNQLLERYGERLSDEKKRNHHKRIHRALERMTQLLDEVLLIGQAEAGKLKFEPKPIDAVAFCQDLVETLALSLEKHTITFLGQDESCNTQMDEKLLGHILTNLLSNAIKYSPDGGEIQFELVCTKAKAVFRITDSGIGIPASDLERLFESFERASNVGMIQGTGLGLAIVKKSVDLHGGTIAVESKVGVGTTFTVTLLLTTD